LERQDIAPKEPLSVGVDDGAIDNTELTRVFIELRYITDDDYKYHSSLTRQLIVRQDPFAEPVTIYNNIVGGYGNFSGFSPNITSSDLP
jgi:hypothetical protein